MALPSVRYEYRIALSHVDRGVHEELVAVASRHPSETAEHLTLRVLAWCLLYRPGLSFGPGLCDGEAADLEAREGPADGRYLLWAECGAAEASRLRRIVHQHSGAEVHVVLSDERRRRELLDGLAALPHGIKGAERVTLWQIDAKLVEALARHDQRRQRWTVTVVGGHLYVDADGEVVDGPASAAAIDQSRV
jgi:uncharacterized protein YaeQ